MVDIFARLEKNAGGPIGQYMSYAHGYYAFPKLEGDIGPHMVFRGKKMLNWSLNNYLGLANHPEVRKADAEGAAQFGMAAPMGARMMSGQTVYHERLERELAAFVGKEDAFLLNFGYQGMISIIDCLLTPRDVVVYDAEAHACIIDGLRLHKGKRFVFGHNDMESLRLQLQHATDLAEEQNGGVLVISAGLAYAVGNSSSPAESAVQTSGSAPTSLRRADRHPWVSWGTTEASAAPPRPSAPMPSDESSGMSLSLSSSEVWFLLVAMRHIWRSSSPSYTPMTVWVFPTSIASNIFGNYPFHACCGGYNRIVALCADRLPL